VTAAWWAFYGTVVFRAVGESALALWNALGSLTLTPSIAAGLQGSHYGAPTPPAVKVLIVARDLTFMVLAGAGLLLAATYLRRVPRLAVVLISTGLVAIVSLGVESVSAQALPNFYAVSFLIPLLACLAALPFAVSRTIAWRIVAPAVAVTVVVTGSLVGFWAHNYAPRHIYDPSVAASVAGEHPAGWEHVTRFLIGSAAFDGRVLTDDGQVLLGGSPLASIDQIYVLGDRETVIMPGDVVVAFRAFRVDSYVAQVQPDRVSVTYSSDQMLGLASAYSLLYADGETNVYRVPGPP
jgi:hypothetical protein